MQKFMKNWIAKDINGVLELFTDDVDYYEKPPKNLKIERP